MSFVAVRRESGIATVVLERGKVNALNPAAVEELSAAFEALRGDAAVRAAILTGSGRFFSFGFEIAGVLGSKRPAAFASIKALLRNPVADAMAVREAASIAEFVDIWYSEPTWTNLRNITIR